MKLKASYTVEAALIISVCFIMFGMAIGLAYELFKMTIEYVAQRDGTFDAVTVFRLKEGAMGVYHTLID